MLRRCIREFSSHRAVRRILRPSVPQTSFHLSSRSEFSSASKQDSSQNSGENVSRSSSNISKFIIGSTIVGVAAMAAYRAGYIDIQFSNETPPHSTNKLTDAKTSEGLEHSVEHTTLPGNEKQITLESEIKMIEKSNEPENEELEIKNEVILEPVPLEEEKLPAEKKEQNNVDSNMPSEATSSAASEQKSESKESLEDKLLDTELGYTKMNAERNKGDETYEENIAEKDGMMESPIENAENAVSTDEEPQKSLSESYSLQDEQNLEISKEGINTAAVAKFASNRESVTEHLMHEESSEAGKVLVGLIDAIHAAEKKQAESDAAIFAEEKRSLKEKFEKELKDARARALMYAEEAAILDKELNKEKVKAAAAIKSLEEKAEKNLQEELQRKDEEANIQLKKVQELAKAELAAAIAKEKSSQLEKIAEADLNINALSMAFYARSEETRQTHSVHKLALGALALEDALSRGLPIQAEVDALFKSLESIDKDSLLVVALSSLPEETLCYGTDTQMQLNQKFDSLKDTLRHFSIIPSGGGGILAHIVAHVASKIKIKEQSGQGIEPIINKVEKLVVDGNFADAADVLEAGVRGSEAEEVVIEWVRQARNRAIAEQALTLLQSYSMSVTFS